MNLFGAKKPKPSAKTSSENVSSQIQEIQKSLDTLEKREKHVEFKLQDQEKAAREKLKARDKRGALFALKRKKMYEGEVSKIQGARMTLEQQRMALESMVTNMEVFSTMRSTAGVMGDMHQNLDAEKVDDIMDEVNEQMSLADEVSNAIAQPVGGQMFDDDELMEELNGMESEMFDNEMLSTPSVPRASAMASGEAEATTAASAAPAPSAPAATTAPYAPPAAAAPAPAAAAPSTEEDELAALQQSMAV